MSVEEIETAVSRLSSEELAAFRRWFVEYDVDGSNPNLTDLEQVLGDRLSGPFDPLEGDWKQRVRDSAAHLGDS